MSHASQSSHSTPVAAHASSMNGWHSRQWHSSLMKKHPPVPPQTLQFTQPNPNHTHQSSTPCVQVARAERQAHHPLDSSNKSEMAQQAATTASCCYCPPGNRCSIHKPGISSIQSTQGSQHSALPERGSQSASLLMVNTHSARSTVQQ